MKKRRSEGKLEAKELKVSVAVSVSVSVSVSYHTASALSRHHHMPAYKVRV